MFESIKKRTASARIVEEQFYEQVVNEIANGYLRNGLWAKAIANSNGQDEKAKALYIQYRVQSLKDEYELLREENIANDQQCEKSVNHEEKDIQNESSNDQEGSTWWIHVLVWSIAGLILLGYLAQ